MREEGLGEFLGNEHPKERQRGRQVIPDDLRHHLSIPEQSLLPFAQILEEVMQG